MQLSDDDLERSLKKYNQNETGNLSGINTRNLLVPGAGIEPARPCDREILSLLCLPISPPGQVIFLLHG